MIGFVGKKETKENCHGDGRNSPLISLPCLSSIGGSVRERSWRTALTFKSSPVVSSTL